MRALCVLHDALSETGLIGAALRDQGWHVDELVVVPADRHASPDVEASFPDSSAYDLLVPMGAPWSAGLDDGRIGRWLAPELEWLADAVAAGGAVFGICFGAQALARALGGSVGRAAHPEIGWVRIDSVVPELIEAGPWFQWHFDRFTLPPGAVELARNSVAVQAYQVGRSLGVQFHPEVTAAGIARWVDNGGAEQARALGIDPVDVLAEADLQAEAAQRRAAALVGAYLAKVFPG
ncbi:GMP synthase-like glutamine amidotransferase [Kibdelosporangium banguiense]|uniref:GMP synthase-like glutamine amidotransferase n=1 Tax=Kibdelosporangium banguiense TaxID=1365924 RepID=A0ABS4U149_9PSEU|nr:type 1 glutamine amidotransferase [Kibdelosporangium banguiense]MBP2330377.1 GMP synthase-like glutamine amidotransferase [Kibdelosporangium banguiense]